jgi:hypothetical protein
VRLSDDTSQPITYESPELLNMIYVDIICSCTGTGSAGIILDYLETLNDQKYPGYQAVVLRGVSTAYSYYVKREYMRTIDLINEYPIFKTNKRTYYLEDIKPILNCLREIPELLDIIDASYFEDDASCNGFLLMKQIKQKVPPQEPPQAPPPQEPPQAGGSKILYKSHYYKIRKNEKNKDYIRTKTGDILISKIKNKKESVNIHKN